MLIEIILFLLLGILAGTFTGLAPGIHINLIGTILVSLSVSLFSWICDSNRYAWHRNAILSQDFHWAFLSAHCCNLIASYTCSFRTLYHPLHFLPKKFAASHNDFRAYTRCFKCSHYACFSSIPIPYSRRWN